MAGKLMRKVRRKPNILFIMADDLGYFEFSHMGHPHMRTPNIDRLAKEGVRFVNVYAGSSLCAPSRCCLLTGKHSGHTSVRVNWGGAPLRPEEETIASVLKRAGYATGGFGKWGCGGRGSTGVPEKHGFDVFFGYYDQVHAHSYYTPYLIRNSKEVPLPGNHGEHEGRTYSHYVIVKEAKRFIVKNKNRPFFCYLAVTPPHGWFDIPETDPAWALYKDKPWPEGAKKYAAMVAMLDRHVGEIIRLLYKLGIAENTIVFFTSDNGGFPYFADKRHPYGFHAPTVNPRTGKAFRGHKGNLYEGGLRVPMIVWWPGMIRPGRVSEFIWYFPDVMPTLAELAGASWLPRDVDGISVVPEILGEDLVGRRQERHRYLYWELYGQVAVRAGRWKAVRPKEGADWELYDIESDPWEARNLAKRRPDVLERLKRFAEEAHEPAREGTYFNFALEARDQWIGKWGSKLPHGVHSLPREGLIPPEEMRVVRASSESKFNFKLAICAIDGSPLTWWHTEWRDRVAKPPHELVIDLGRRRTIRGFVYLPRQDKCWNGTIKDCEFYVSDDPRSFGRPVIKVRFRKTKEPQKVLLPKPVRGRYVMLRALSEVNGGPWASVAELGVIGE